ncbi:MAG: hypothetical protein ACH346_05245 [Chthoniobacterales bacterium]
MKIAAKISLLILSLTLSVSPLFGHSNISEYTNHPLPIAEFNSKAQMASKLAKSVLIFLTPDINGKNFTISKSRGGSVIVTSLYRTYFESKIEHPEVLPLHSSVTGGLGIMNSTLRYQPGELGSTALTFTYEPADDRTIDQEKIKITFTVTVVE